MELEASDKNIKTNEKVRRILQKLLEPNLKVSKDVDLNLFLKCFAGKDDVGQPLPKPSNKQLIGQFCEWIIYTSNLWEKSEVSPPPTVLSFALDLSGQLSCDEQVFVNLNSKNVYESLVVIAQRNLSKDPTVTNGMVTLLSSFLEHKSGAQWVMANSHWTDVINFGLTSHTPYIRKNAYQFIAELLRKTICFNRNFGNNLVAIVIKPIKDVFLRLPGNKDNQLSQTPLAEHLDSLKPTLELISGVSSLLLKSFNTTAIQLFLEQGTPEMIDQILPLALHEDLSFRLLKVQFVFLLYKLCMKLDGVKVVSHDSLAIRDIQIIFDLIGKEMEKNNVKCVVKICDFAHDLYCCLAPHLPLCVRKGEVIEFENQMLLFQIMPILVFSIQVKLRDVKKAHPENAFLNDDFRKRFIMRLIRIAAVKSLQVCTKWKEILQHKPDLMEDITFALQYIANRKNLLNKERAAIMFPALVYVLKDTLIFITTMENVEWTSSGIEFISTLVETIVDLVESFDLTWKDSIETIRVMDLACDFLEYPNWGDKIIVVKGLKLLNTAISKYMSPDMALLIYSKSDSTIYKSASLLYAKCHDSCWEIRDSALEVIHTLALSANTNFPALTSLLLDAALPQLIVNMAINDGEYCVRTTAVRCLQQFIQIVEIWDVLQSGDGFLEDILNVCECDEGIVRKEAAELIAKIYKFQGFPDKLLLRLYDVMTHAAIGDSYWEVKYHALNFWFNTWFTYLTNQGMIDLSFPTHTFSKEHKKIVVLTKIEIKKRLIKVLNQLSNCGCLYVMMMALKDADVEIFKFVFKVHQKIVRLFKEYKISSDTVDLSEPPVSSTRPNPQYQPLVEPVSPGSSTTLTAPSPANFRSLESPEQFDYTQWFDPFSPCPAEVTPSSTSHNLDSTDLQWPPQSNQTSYDSSRHSQEVPVQATPNSELDPHYCEPMVDQNTSIESILGMIDMGVLGGCDEYYSDVKVADGVTKNTIQRKTKTYLPPSKYLEFIYNEVEMQEKAQTQQLSSCDEFDSLLDDILKVYNLDVDANGMDCY